ncbi:histidinol dehydrogenase [Microbacterium tenebrionis]|uniref:histidinol dehydrogenase n=1 Tax=Microbacterium tenebrionis TaxID=2830665 RepID=UPI001D0D2CF4|nr:histidinol dehydrogenase [Microbacterium tenebrionis]
MPNWLSRLLSWIAAALVGVVYGTAGTIAHSLMWGPVPIGFIVAAIACGALLIAVRALTNDRAATIATALGMIGMLLIISGPGPGGSVIVPNTPIGQIWIYVVCGIALLVIAWPNLKRSAPQPTRRSALNENGS